jgi:pilus assembly protein CpaE
VTVWKPLIVSPSPDRLKRAVAGAGLPDAIVLADYGPPRAIADLVARHACNICFLDVATDQEKALPVITEAAPLIRVVAVIPCKDADVILRALRRGACEFLPDPSADQVRSLLDRLDRTRTPVVETPQGKLSCLVPGKPGCGASTLAVHLAAAAHAGGDSRTLLVDADAMTASIGFLLKLKSEYHLGDVLRDWNRMDDDLWSRLVAPFDGMEVLLAPEDPAARSPVSPAMAAELVAFWKKRYDAVVIDTPDARAAVETGFAALADDVLLVTTNELAALHATRRALGSLQQNMPDRGRLRLILNRYNPATGLKRDDVKTALQVEPFATLTNDYDLLQAAILDGKPAPARSRFGSSIHALSQLLRGRAPAPKKDGWLGRLSPAK